MATRTAELAGMRSYLRSCLAEAGVSEADCRKLVAAADEAVTSIVEEAGEAGRQGEVRIVLDIDDQRVKATIDDTGKEFCLRTEAAPAGRRAGERQDESDLGVFLMRSVCDEITYAYRRGVQNELELVKFRS